MKNDLKIEYFKSISALLFLSIILVSCNQEEKKLSDSFTVSGTIVGLDTKYMSSSYSDEAGNRMSDSVFVNDNHFTYTAKVTQPTHIIFWPNVEKTIKRSGRGYYPAKSSQFAFLASPGDDIKFKGEVTDFIDAYPYGTAANEDLAKINSKVFPLMNKSVNALLQKEKLEVEDSSGVRILEQTIDELDNKVIELKKEFINSNLKSEAAIWYLSDMMMRSQITDEEAIDAFGKIDLNFKEYPYYKDIASRVQGIESTQIGKSISDFTTKNTMDESKFSFSDLEGKYVLIDFWGTWCGPCVAEMPELKEYQEKYKDKLVVLGINSGDSKEKIENFISKNDYSWTQLMAGKGNDNLVLRFNVSGFPTKFIIDPFGKIMHRFVGGGEESFTTLDSILNRNLGEDY